MKNPFVIFIFISVSLTGFGQSSDKVSLYFSEPIIADSSSTIIIPTRYNTALFSSSKIALWNAFYANIIFYDFKTDSFRKLFTEDTFIESFTGDYSLSNRFDRNRRPENISSKWIFYFVKPTDYDESGRIDNDDPSILYVSDKQGNGLKSISPENENAVSIDIFDKLGIALLKMQRDVDGDNDFESDDEDYYYVRLDLNTMTFGNKIEID